MMNSGAMPPADQPIASVSRLQVGLLLAWFVASFGVVFFAHDLQQIVVGWPLAYWFAAQGSVLAFILVVAIDNSVFCFKSKK